MADAHSSERSQDDSFHRKFHLHLFPNVIQIVLKALLFPIHRLAHLVLHINLLVSSLLVLFGTKVSQGVV